MGEGVGEAGDRRLEGGEGAGDLLAVGGEVHGFFWVVVSRSYTYSVQWGQSEGWCGERRLAGGFLFGGLGTRTLWLARFRRHWERIGTFWTKCETGWTCRQPYWQCGD